MVLGLQPRDAPHEHMIAGHSLGTGSQMQGPTRSDAICRLMRAHDVLRGVDVLAASVMLIQGQSALLLGV